MPDSVVSGSLLYRLHESCVCGSMVFNAEQADQAYLALYR